MAGLGMPTPTTPPVRQKRGADPESERARTAALKTARNAELAQLAASTRQYLGEAREEQGMEAPGAAEAAFQRAVDAALVYRRGEDAAAGVVATHLAVSALRKGFKLQGGDRHGAMLEATLLQVAVMDTKVRGRGTRRTRHAYALLCTSNDCMGADNSCVCPLSLTLTRPLALTCAPLSHTLQPPAQVVARLLNPVLQRSAFATCHTDLVLRMVRVLLADLVKSECVFEEDGDERCVFSLPLMNIAMTRECKLAAKHAFMRCSTERTDFEDRAWDLIRGAVGQWEPVVGSADDRVRQDVDQLCVCPCACLLKAGSAGLHACVQVYDAQACVCVCVCVCITVFQCVHMSMQEHQGVDGPGADVGAVTGTGQGQQPGGATGTDHREAQLDERVSHACECRMLVARV